MRYGVILAGGRGFRLWPLSRNKRPKQFVPLLPNGNSLFQETVCRLTGVVDQIIVVAGKNIQQGDGPEWNGPPLLWLEEPQGKDTGPAVALALRSILAGDQGQGVVGIFPADHFITPDSVFREQIERIFQFCQEEKGLVTIGIPPSSPNQNYGYIQVETPVANNFFSVRRFVEKPSSEKARQFIQEGGYFWNSGMFFSSVDFLLKAYQTHAPAIWQAVNDICWEEEYRKLKPISFDYCLAEKVPSIFMLPALFAWDDLGSWDSLLGVIGDPESGQFGDVTAISSENCLAYAKAQPIVLYDVEGLLVTVLDDVVCVTRRDSNLKKLIELLSARGRSDLL